MENIENIEIPQANVFVDGDRVIYVTPHTYNDVLAMPEAGHTSTDFPFWTAFVLVGHMCNNPEEISDGIFAFISDEDDMLMAIDMPSPLSNGVPKEATISVLRDYLNEDEITDIIENATIAETGLGDLMQQLTGNIETLNDGLGEIEGIVGEIKGQ